MSDDHTRNYVREAHIMGSRDGSDERWTARFMLLADLGINPATTHLDTDAIYDAYEQAFDDAWHNYQVEGEK